MGRTKGLTPKQEAFVREYLVDLNASQAALRAGYSKSNHDSIAQQLLAKTHVKDAIAAATAAISQKNELTVQWVVDRLKTEAEGRGPDTSPSARVAATKHLGDYLQMFEKKDSLESILARLGPQLAEAVRGEIARLVSARRSGGSGQKAP